MFRLLCVILIAFPSVVLAEGKMSLLKAREGFKTEIHQEKKEKGTFDDPPPKLMSIVKYPTPIGEMSAYLTQPAEKNKKYPAIIWITGGFPPGGAGSSVWEETSRDNDQSAKNYWQNDVISMYPSFRGSYSNPGKQEGFFGEVDDLLSALNYLSKIEYVDAERIYLGGHSTGGTLALLVAAATPKFKGIFAFGPASDPAGYGAKRQLHNTQNTKENYLRAPINFLDAIQAPTYIIEGARGNLESFKKMQQSTENRNVNFIRVEMADHFDLLFPTNRLIAKKIRSGAPVALNQKEVQLAYDDVRSAERETDDLSVLMRMRLAGQNLATAITAEYILYAEESKSLEKAVTAIKKRGYSVADITSHTNSKGRTYHSMRASKSLRPIDLKAVFQSSKAVSELAVKYQLYYNGWRAQ